MYMSTHIYNLGMCVYIYVHKPREREREGWIRASGFAYRLSGSG